MKNVIEEVLEMEINFNKKKNEGIQKRDSTKGIVSLSYAH
jgi:hypothetical protein